MRATTPMTLLCATDGSPGAATALRLVRASFDPANVGSVEVLSVVARTLVPGIPSPGTEAPETEMDAGRRQAAEGVVRRAAEGLRRVGFDVTEAVPVGHPAESIVAHATASRPDLVVLGTRGLGGTRRRVVGSVSGQVARYAPTSVLVARTPGPIRSIVLGYDASPDADRALDLVARLPLRAPAQITIVTAYQVETPLSTGSAPTMTAQVGAAYRDALRWAREASEAIAAMAVGRLAPLGVQASSRVDRGAPRDHLAIAARELDADLVVVGSRGLSAIARFLLGSTTAGLLAEPPTNVLVARSATD